MEDVLLPFINSLFLFQQKDDKKPQSRRLQDISTEGEWST